MKCRKFVIGLVLCCLLTLQGCAPARPSLVLTSTPTTCPAVAPCTLPAERPQWNGDLNLVIERLEGAWALCAAKVDAIIRCQEEDRNAQGH
ncbi:Rz1-like lysis system protein LysC [Achromobacter sp. UMC71]|uniref:Rz1-like lysis system protein LysC n=1 Tax=Achromobacter sp. UMC71 TaxID=1862320 RepID=UPI001C7E1E0B